MRQNFFLFLLSPLFLFATIEIAQEPQAAPKKNIEKTETNGQIEQAKPQATTAKKEPFPPAKAPVVKKETKKQEIAKVEPSTQERAEEERYPESAATVPSYLDDEHSKQFFLTLIIICVVILFALIVIYIFKRASPMSAITRKNSRNNIKILERRALSPQTYLYHIQVGDKQFILSESKVEVRSVATLDWSDPK